MTGTLAWIAAGFLGIAFLVMLNRRRRPALDKAYEAFGRVTQSAGPELERLSSLFAQVRDAVGEREAFHNRGLSGKTRELGELVLDKVDALEAMSEELQRVLTEGDQLLHPAGPLAQAANMTTSSRYLHCLNLVNGSPLQVSAFPRRDDVPENNWVGFDPFYALLRDRRQATEASLREFSSNLQGLESSVATLQEKLDSLSSIESRWASQDREAIQATRSRKHPHLHSLSAANRWLGLPSLFDKLVPQLELETQQAIRDAEEDPVGVRQGELPRLEQKLGDILMVAKAIERSHEQHLPEIERTQARLTDLGFNARWIDRRKRELGDEANRLMEAALKGDITELAQSFENGLKSFAVRVTQASERAETLDTQIQPMIEAVKAEIDAARDTISSRLGISTTMALRESEYSPDDELQRAKQQLIAAKASLSRGDLDAVNSAIGEIEVETHEASKFVQNSLVALDEFEGKFALRKTALESLAARMPEVKQSIERLRSRFDEAALLVEHAGGDPYSFRVKLSRQMQGDDPAQVETTSLVVLYQKACDWIRELTQQLNSAERGFGGGDVLESCNLVDLIEFDLQDLDRFVVRIEERSLFVRQLAAKNKTDFENVKTRLQALQSSVGQRPDGSASANAMRQLESCVSRWQAKSGASGRPNPIEDFRLTSEMRQLAEEVESLCRLEDETFQEVVDALEGVESELRIARQLVHNSHHDGIPDSQQITQDQQLVARSESLLQEFKRELQNPQADLRAIDQRVTQLQVDLSLTSGRLRNELKGARQAASLIQQAAEVVFRAAQWRGDFNIVVVGRPGADELNRARQALANGDYHHASLFAQEASREANHAIVAAEAQVTRYRRHLVREARRARNFRN